MFDIDILLCFHCLDSSPLIVFRLCCDLSGLKPSSLVCATEDGRTARVRRLSQLRSTIASGVGAAIGRRHAL